MAKLCVAALLATTALSPGAPNAAPSPRLDAHAITTARFGNDAAWYENNIPLFESSDQKLDEIYYYRWSIYRAHQRDLGPRGYITTEFLDDVGWQREPYASLNDATGFHIQEGRWLRDRRYAGDYIDFMYGQGGNDRHFSEAIADATWARFLVDGDQAAATRHLAVMKHIYALWDDHYDFDKKLYWIEPLLDATEYTISSVDASGGKDGFRGGDAFRPSINSYMYANARAISRLAALTGDKATAADYAARAADLKAQVQKSLWSQDFAHFIDRYKVNNEHVKYWDPIRGRELVGYLPWTFGLPDDTPAYARAWKHAVDPSELAGPHGLRTVEPSYQYYMRQYRYEGTAPECQWNGPVWPFQTTQALTGLANLLNDYHQDVVTRADYARLLAQYTALHYQDGKPDLEEDYDPATGKPIVGLARSHHYNHSGYVDLIISGLVGLRPRADDVLEVNPLAPTDPADPNYLKYFRLQDVAYHGRLVTIAWDADGSRYGRRGLVVSVDGKEVAASPILARLTAPLARKAPAPMARPIDLAVNLVRSDYPRGAASSGADPKTVHQALDGRVWFFPEMANGWSPGVVGEAWFEVDFGKPTAVNSAELSFYADDKTFAAPARYRLEAWKDGKWVEVARAGAPLANGVDRTTWASVTASKLRAVFDLAPGKDMRLVEMKVF
ncbi:MAG: discoidin domain-containing protein [Caulobacter sp.]|nr:discoidin domain-containing protein [Caulobacter sp.]